MVRDKLMALSGEERFVMGAQMFESACEVVKASLPHGLSEVELRRQLFRRLYGKEISSLMSLTLVEKIAARHADGLPAGAVVHAGDFVSIRPRHVMTHDNTAAVMPKFKQIGANAIADPGQPVFAIDHDIQNTTPKNLEKYAKIEAFAARAGGRFLPAGHGHFASGDGGAGICGSGRVGRGERFALQSVRRGRGVGHARRANRRREYLGDGSDLVASAQSGEGGAEG